MRQPETVNAEQAQPPENLFRNVETWGLRQPDLEGGGPANLPYKTSGPQLNVSTPYLTGYSYSVGEHDQFRIGNVFFFDIRAVSGAVLHSDNIDLSATNPHSGTIGVVILTGSA